MGTRSPRLVNEQSDAHVGCDVGVPRNFPFLRLVAHELVFSDMGALVLERTFPAVLTNSVGVYDDEIERGLRTRWANDVALIGCFD